MSTVETLAERVEGIVHETTQIGDRGVDLTVTEVYDVTGPGRVDFGDGELEAATTSPHERVWRNEDDDYQWWELDAGQYLIEYNESLMGNGGAILQPRDAIIERGASHPTLVVSELPRVALSVPDSGFRVKENARLSTLLPR